MHEIQFHIYYAHIYVEFFLCIVVLSNYFGPNEFGDHFVLKYVLGIFDMHWMLASFSKKLLSPHVYWRQATMMDEFLSTTTSPMLPR